MITLSEAIASVEKTFASIFATHPEIAEDLQGAVTETVAGLKDAATTAVGSANLPPIVSTLVDAEITSVQAQIDALTAKLVSLQAAKGATA